MLRFLKKIFSTESIVAIYVLGLFSIIAITGYHLFYAIDWFSVGKYLLIIALVLFMLSGVVKYHDKNKEK
jgi:cytochrome oxidase assembly protein ShyY1